MNQANTKTTVSWFSNDDWEDKRAMLHVEGREPKLISETWPWKVIEIKAKSKG